MSDKTPYTILQLMDDKIEEVGILRAQLARRLKIQELFERLGIEVPEGPIKLTPIGKPVSQGGGIGAIRYEGVEYPIEPAIPEDVWFSEYSGRTR